MTGDEQSWSPAVLRSCGWEVGFGGKHGINGRITGHVDFAANLFRAEICGRNIGGREKKIGLRVDRGAILLLRPGPPGVVRPQPSFDVSHGDTRQEACQGGAQGA
jgi:hypothetical protein